MENTKMNSLLLEIKQFISECQSPIRDPAWHSSDSNQIHIDSGNRGSGNIQLVIHLKLFWKSITAFEKQGERRTYSNKQCILIKNTKTTFMEDVSRGELKKIKNI